MGWVRATSLGPWVGSWYGKTRPEPDPFPFLEEKQDEERVEKSDIKERERINQIKKRI